MRRIVLVAGLAAALLTLPSCAGSPPDPGAIESTTATDVTDGAPLAPSNSELGAVFVPALQDAGMPGGEVLVLNGDGSSEHAAWASDIPGAQVSSDSVLAYRSITKSFVGTVILQLADEGALALTDRINQYVAGVPNGDVITIDDLGRMRSGIANYTALPAMGEALSTRLDDPPASAMMLEWAFAASPEFAPGAQFEYSNTNTVLLGEVIEAVTGQPWFDEVRARILEPLKLTSVGDGFSGGPDDATGFNLAADADPDPLPQIAPAWFGAAGALTGNITDLATWGDALGSGQLVDADTQFARVRSLAPITDDPASPEYDRYGFAMGEIEGWVGHTGNGLGFQSLVMHDPATDRTVAILVNGTGDDGDVPAHLFKKLLPVLNEEPAQP